MTSACKREDFERVNAAHLYDGYLEKAGGKNTLLCFNELIDQIVLERSPTQRHFKYFESIMMCPGGPPCASSSQTEAYELLSGLAFDLRVIQEQFD